MPSIAVRVVVPLRQPTSSAQSKQAARRQKDLVQQESRRSDPDTVPSSQPTVSHRSSGQDRTSNGAPIPTSEPKSHSRNARDPTAPSHHPPSKQPTIASQDNTPMQQPVYNPSYFKPKEQPYKRCSCDRVGNGRALLHAIGMGAVSYIINPDGSSSAHLFTCPVNPSGNTRRYNPQTIATDILRAEGAHPQLPTLNWHIMRRVCSGELSTAYV